VVPPDLAARQLAAEINRTIARNIERQPQLRERARALQARSNFPQVP